MEKSSPLNVSEHNDILLDFVIVALCFWFENLSYVLFTQIHMPVLKNTILIMKSERSNVSGK